MKDNELHAEDGVLGNKLGVAASEIEGGSEKGRIARRSGGWKVGRSKDTNAETYVGQTG